MKSKIPEIRNIWRKILNRKLKKGFTLYLAALDFEEFDAIFSYYSTVMYRLRKTYDKKYRFLSKNWFKKKIINYKYNQIFNLFAIANLGFIDKSNELLKQRNLKLNNIIRDIQESREIIEHISKNPVVINMYSTQEDILKFYFTLISNAYNANKLVESINELNSLKNE